MFASGALRIQVDRTDFVKPQAYVKATNIQCLNQSCRDSVWMLTQWGRKIALYKASERQPFRISTGLTHMPTVFHGYLQSLKANAL
jgi:hypothetical protein